MFTGIVQSVGTITAVTPKGGDIELCIRAPRLDLSNTILGDSISCSGCCLTVTKIDKQSFCVDVSRESLSVTTLQSWRVGTEINLEKALRAGDALGGHYVSGHVDAVGKVVAMNDDGRSMHVDFEVPKKLGRYVARKGSICVDGVSLTVNAVTDKPDTTRFDVNLIPHTREQTVLRNYTPSTQVNIEVDMIARYIDRMREAS
ncbi:MAG TPA: riboflavin synthase [Steroidobacteraceae bacterium]|nr:riboflavin synthase [Steroidobacteraceae bacterium]